MCTRSMRAGQERASVHDEPDTRRPAPGTRRDRDRSRGCTLTGLSRRGVEAERHAEEGAADQLVGQVTNTAFVLRR